MPCRLAVLDFFPVQFLTPKTSASLQTASAIDDNGVTVRYDPKFLLLSVYTLCSGDTVCLHPPVRGMGRVRVVA